MSSDRIRELLAIDLAEQPESFDPDWISQHLDTQRIRHDLIGNLVAAVLEEKGNLPATAAVAEARAQLDSLMDDPRELIAVLGEELAQYLRIEEAAEDAVRRGIDFPIRGQLQDLMADLDEGLGVCKKCHEIPVQAGEDYCDSCKREVGVDDGY